MKPIIYNYYVDFYTRNILCLDDSLSASLAPASLQVEITTSGGDTVAGEQYTLTCTVTVPESSVLSCTPIIVWIGDEGMTGGITAGTPDTLDRVTTSTLTFNPLQDSQDGDYTCNATLPFSGMDPTTGKNAFTLNVVGRSVHVVARYSLAFHTRSTLCAYSTCIILMYNIS